jgi:uncharacterized protein (DUF885 family)
MRRREFVHRSARTVAAFGILRHLGACRPSGDGVAPSPFSGIRDRYFVRTLELNPVVSTYLGGDGYSPALPDVNGRLRDYRPEALRNEAAFYHEIQAALAKVDRAKLDAAERIDAAVLESQLAFLLHQVEGRRYHERSVDTYVAEPFRGVDWQQQQMESFPGELLGSQREWQLLIARMEAIPAYVDTALANLSEGKRRDNRHDRRMVQRDGIEGSAANAEYFRRTLPDGAKKRLGDRPFAAATMERLTAACGRAAEAYERFARG